MFRDPLPGDPKLLHPRQLSNAGAFYQPGSMLRPLQHGDGHSSEDYGKVGHEVVPLVDKGGLRRGTCFVGLGGYCLGIGLGLP
jgi:hypothetical protein